MLKLGVNVDHVATLREARKERNPDPVAIALMAEMAGANGITAHMREDLRHIQERDMRLLRQTVTTRLNLEMAPTAGMVEFALELQPDMVTLVPERRAELTTEGGLDVRGNFDRIRSVVGMFHEKKVIVSLFIEPDIETVELSKKSGADYIEIHTGTYCNEFYRPGSRRVKDEIDRIYLAAERACAIGIGVNAGHGLDCKNLPAILGAPGLEELNIGFSIIARSLFIGLPAAVKEMLRTIIR